MRILVTGATGFVGNNCVRKLVEQGIETHVLVRRDHDPRSLQGLDVQKHYADLSNLDELSRSLPQVEGIVHAAADLHIGGVPRPQQHQVNVEATRIIAQRALDQVSRLVFVSSVDALPAATPTTVVNEQSGGSAKSNCGYVQTKRAAEDVIRQWVTRGLDAVIVNPGFMLGPWDWKPSSGRMLLQVAQRFTPFAPTGGFSLCDVRDVAAAILNALLNDVPARQYILAGENMRYIDAWRHFAQLTGRKGPYCCAGPIARFLAGSYGDLRAAITGREGDVNSASIGMSSLFHYYDSSLAQQDLAYTMRPLSESIHDAWHWFREYGYVVD